MEIVVKKCGVVVNPPSFVVVYKFLGKLRRKVIPLRNFSVTSDLGEMAGDLKKKSGLEKIPLIKIKKMLRLLQEILKGNDIPKAVKKVEKEYEVNLNEDFNKLPTQELEMQKELMESLFLKNQIKKDDSDFVYDKRLDFPDPKTESDWDLDVDDNFWS